MTFTPYVCRYRHEEGTTTVLVCSQTKTYTTAVGIIGGKPAVKRVRLSTGEARHLSEAFDYRPKKAARNMLKAGRTLGIQKTARRALSEVLQS